MGDASGAAGPTNPAQHVAKVEVKLGRFSASSRLAITSGGIMAVSGLVGVILGGTTAIVWVATGPARRRAVR
ncbi:MAG: hypothetical protein EON93_00890 [Burkholderiales bacterium]|nr:MAG: hypothetical protein EON93_00890 [Burkholderiales bacterium]